MKLQKLIFIILFSIISNICYADDLYLLTINKTNEYSVAKVKTSGRCSATLNKITKPNGELRSYPAEVALLCGKEVSKKEPCVASIIMSKNEKQAARCEGKTIGKAGIDNLKTLIVTSIEITDPAYDIQGKDTTTIVISKIK